VCHSLLQHFYNIAAKQYTAKNWCLDVMSRKAIAAAVFSAAAVTAQDLYAVCQYACALAIMIIMRFKGYGRSIIGQTPTG
jgi:hypothetical protein